MCGTKIVLYFCFKILFCTGIGPKYLIFGQNSIINDFKKQNLFTKKTPTYMFEHVFSLQNLLAFLSQIFGEKIFPPEFVIKK